MIPAVFALGLEPTSGPGLIFATLPKVVRRDAGGRAVRLLFFVGLFGAGYLSDVGAFEVLVAGLTDNTKMTRERAVWLVTAAIFVAAIPPTINNAHLRAVGPHVRVGNADPRVARRGAHGRLVHETIGAALKQLGERGEVPVPVWLYYWIRFGIPAAIGGVGIWWLLSSVFNTVKPV